MLSLLVILACKKDEGTPVADDTAVPGGDDSAVDSPVEPCVVKPSAITPEDESEEVYWREPITVAFTGSVETASFTLRRTDTAATTAVEEAWNDDRSAVVLTPSPNLDPSAPYALDITVCEVTYTSTLSTAAWGTPLETDIASLKDKTYVIELGKVNFTKPEGIGGILALYLDSPLLIGVTEVNETTLTMLGAQGRITSDGLYAQRKKSDGVDLPTWDFSGVDFSEAPFFSGDTEQIDILYSGVHIPITDFHIEGTFAADGSAFGGAKVSGLGDTRDMGELISQPDTPGAICDMVAGVGATCQECPDGEPYCLFLEGEDITAPLVPDVVLERIEAPALR